MFSAKLEFIIPGPAVPKARPRVGPRGAITPKTTKDYEEHVSSIVVGEWLKAGQPKPAIKGSPVTLGSGGQYPHASKLV